MPALLLSLALFAFLEPRAAEDLQQQAAAGFFSGVERSQLLLEQRAEE